MTRASPTPPAPESADPRTRRAMRLSILDAITYALMVGTGETYFLADGVRLGATPLELGLVVSLPLCLGAAGPLLAVRLLGRLRARKPVVVGAALGQSAVLGALSAFDARAWSSPISLIALVCLYQVFSQAAGTAWSSWYGDLVPADVRGRYFARRNRLAHLSTALGLLAGGLVLSGLEPARAAEGGMHAGAGFATIFAVACGLRLFSTGLLAASPENPFQGLPDRVRVVRFLATARGTQAWRQVLLVAVLQYVVYVASPYFQPYMLRDLRFTYFEFMLASMSVVACKVLFLPVWGRLIDANGPRAICAICALFLALVPLPWLWARGLVWVAIAQGFSGMSWAGFEVSQFTLLLETTYKRTRLVVFAAQSVSNGFCQLLGGLTGALLAGGAALDLRVVFAISLAGRLVVASAFPRMLPAPAGVPELRARDLLLRVVGVRPAAGVVHQPIDATQGEPEEPRAAESG